jgi:2-methylcitrate dehydratase PrpD
VHQGFDAAREVARQMVAREMVLDPTRIARIDVGTYAHAIDAPFRTTLEPATASAAGYSLPTAVAIGLTFPTFYADDIARFADPRVRALLPKMHLHVDDQIEAHYPNWNGCGVRISLDDGRVVESRLTHAKGEPENMLTDTEFDAKLRFAVGELLPEPQLKELVAAVQALEDARDVSVLARLATRQAAK